MGLMMVPFVKRASCTKEVWQKPRSACDRLYCLTKHNINAICTVLHTNRFHTSINSPQAETTKKCLMLSGNQKKMLTIFTNHLILWPKHDILTKNTSSKDSFSAPTWTDLHHSSSKCSIFTTYWLNIYKQIDITTVWMRLCLEKVSTVEIWDHCLSLKACDHSCQIISFCQACCHSQ